jgi:hypothetical protein
MTQLKHLPTLATIQHNLKYAGWTGVSGEHIRRPDPVNAWCRDTIGSFGDWDRVGYDYWFRREQDAVMFILRWGG